MPSYHNEKSSASRKTIPWGIAYRLDIDPKFHIEACRDEILIVKTSNDQVIPDDEPLMLFRAGDRHATEAILHYREICNRNGCNAFQMDSIDERLSAFRSFQQSHPERMKQPGITRGK